MRLFHALHATWDSPAWSIALARALVDAPVILAVAVTAWRLARTRHLLRGGLLILLACMLTRLVEEGVSVLAFHARPFASGVGTAWIEHAANNSMPSSHVTIVLVLLLALLHLGERRWVALVAMLALANAWARIHLGLHWPQDMLGALGSAAPCVGLAILLQRLLGQPRKRSMSTGRSSTDQKPAASPRAG